MTIKILHISDLHFVLDPQANIMQTLLLKEASAVASFPVGQKLLVITGDFHNFKNNDYLKLRTPLSGKKLRHCALLRACLRCRRGFPRGGR